MAENQTKRANEKKAKTDFQAYLSRNFDVESIDDKSKTTDIIMKLKDGTKWFFELKCTTRAVLRKNKKYFGAISLNQWKEASKNKRNYYFVIAIEEETKEFTFLKVSPDRISQYITGYYAHTDFNIPIQQLATRTTMDIEEQIRQLNNFDDCLSPKDGKQSNNIDTVISTFKTKLQ